MKPETRPFTKCLAVVALLHGLSGLAVLGASAQAQQQDGAALLAAGAKALDAKQFTVAVRQLTRAMRADGLSNDQIAKALLMRGVAQQGAGKPAQAISDLNSALWLQGLSNKDLALAYVNRSAAYSAVGMGDRAQADARRAREIDPNSQAVIAARTPDIGTFETQVEAAPQGTARESVPGFTTRVTQSDAPARERVPNFQTQVRTAARDPAPVPSFRTSILPDEKQAARPAPAPARPARPSQPAPDWSTSVAADQAAEADVKEKKTGFFSSLWNSSNKKDEEKRDVSEPASDQATTGWNQTTTVASGQAPATAPAQPSRADGRSYRIQLAALRSAAEAQSTWERLAARHQGVLAGRSPVIEKTDVGNLGTFYRIQIGPFESKKESAQVCNNLKASGVDCFLVVR